MVNFTISDGDKIPYESIKQDYINGLRGDKLREKYNLTTKRYSGLLKDFEADGVQTGRRQKKYRKPKYFSYNQNQKSYVVQKTINGERIYGGTFKRRIDAEQRVKELNANGWIV